MSNKKAGAGDNGKSRLGRGIVYEKNHPLFKTLGCLDEVNSLIGSIIDDHKEVYYCLEETQKYLMNLSCHLYSPEDHKFETREILWVNERIKEYDSKLPQLTKFLLPRGKLHLVRAKVRIAEQSYVDVLSYRSPNGLIFLNRLSDLFFVLARYVAHNSKDEEITYKFERS